MAYNIFSHVGVKRPVLTSIGVTLGIGSLVYYGTEKK